MKKLCLVLLLLSTSAIADPSTLSQQYQMCTYYALKASQYMVIARASKDADNFKTIVEADIAGVSPDSVQNSLKFIANLIWGNRQTSPTDAGMSIYNDCVKQLGTAT